MTRKMWQVDAFAAKVLEGNPAAVVPLDNWLDADLMQRIAGENNLAETAFFVKTAPGRYDLRWFTPVAEVDLCGHATLASAFVIFRHLDSGLTQIEFATRSGTLVVRKGDHGNLIMSLPSNRPAPYAGPVDLAQRIGDALGVAPPLELYKSAYLMAVWDDPKTIRAIKGPGDIARVLRDLNIWGAIVTAPGDDGYDFISRFFAPSKGVPEDPVTGSAHCALTPFWSAKLGKTRLKARQASPRGGSIICTDDGEKTVLEGSCALYLTGEISL